MNRNQRRAAKAREGRDRATAHVPKANIVAAHEAGHAIARYLTAAEMGYSTEESITSIEIASPGAKRYAGTSVDGGTKFFIQATTFGPMLTKEIGQVGKRVAERERIHSGAALVEREWLDHLSQVISEARAEGVDIESWLQARALISVMGPAVEAMLREKPIAEILESDESEGDLRGFIQDCMIAKVSESEFSPRIDAAVERAVEFLGDSNVIAAVNALAAHLLNNGTTDGKTAVRIIGEAMETEAV